MSTLRIISGSAKGMRIKSVPGDSTRPITDRVKESLFNIIGNDVSQSAFLDLFGGTGSVSIEALSRGAVYARILELNSIAVQTIKSNLQTTHLAQLAQVIRTDSLSYLKTIPDRTFDYVYIAPPQYKRMWITCMDILDQNDKWLHADGWIIVQIHPKEQEALNLQHFSLFDERKYGSTLLLFFQRSN